MKNQKKNLVRKLYLLWRQKMFQKDVFACHRWQTLDNKLQFSIYRALEEEQGRMYLRNDYSLCSAIGQAPSSKSKSWLQATLRFSDVRTGPAEPYKKCIPLIDTHIKLDEVLALRNSYSSIINKCCERFKNSSWPSDDLIEKKSRHLCCSCRG